MTSSMKDNVLSRNSNKMQWPETRPRFDGSAVKHTLLTFKNLKTFNPPDVTTYLSRKAVLIPLSLAFKILRKLSSKLSLDVRLELADEKETDNPFSLSLIIKLAFPWFSYVKLPSGNPEDFPWKTFLHPWRRLSS